MLKRIAIAFIGTTIIYTSVIAQVRVSKKPSLEIGKPIPNMVVYNMQGRQIPVRNLIRGPVSIIAFLKPT